MELANKEDNISNQSVSVTDFSIQMQRVAYPALRWKLSEIFTLANSALNHNLKKAEVMSLCHQLASNLDTMYVAEQSTLLPMLLWLENTGGYAENCKPFKAVKQLYTALLVTLRKFRAGLSSLAGEMESNDDMAELNEALTAFEQQVIRLQIDKENNLYNRFRNCSNSCNTL